MQGDPQVVELLNEVLTAELTAVNQYFLDAKMFDNWGYERLAERFRSESIDEMKDADHLIERLLYLEGHPNPHALRVSDELPPQWFDQVTGEVRRVRYVRNRPVIEFTPKRRGQQVEALDALCYAWGVRQSPAQIGGGVQNVGRQDEIERLCLETLT